MESSFDPNGPSQADSGIFGLPSCENSSQLIILPVPWEATVSFGKGTSRGPEVILEASKYVELYDPDFKDFYEHGIVMASSNLKALRSLNDKARKYVESALLLDNKLQLSRAQQARRKKYAKDIDDLCAQMNREVFEQVNYWLGQKRVVGVVGGDHSVALGTIDAHLQRFPNMTVLQIDAHCDLRKSFEQFTYSHASVMFNVISQTKLRRLVQVGIRDLCQEEYERSKNSKGRIRTFFQNELVERTMSGESWKQTCKRIISATNREVYVSFDVDGLDPSLCPNTGTPVPGGLSFQEAVYLIKQLVLSGRRIVGFDLVETAPANSKKPNDINANTAAHLLYKLCGWCLRSNQRSTLINENVEIKATTRTEKHRINKK